MVSDPSLKGKMKLSLAQQCVPIRSPFYCAANHISMDGRVRINRMTVTEERFQNQHN